MEYISYGFSNYFNFDGRATRKQFWMFILFIFIGSIIARAIDSLLGTFVFYHQTEIISIIYSLAVFFPNLSISIRRLHDIGKSGFWILINMIPIIGAIVLLIFFCTESEPSLNEYGPPANFIQLDNN